MAGLTGWQKGSSVDDRGIKKAVESLNFKIIIKENSNFEEISSWLERKAPVIVDWFSRGRSDYSDAMIADGHYSVVCGIDDINIYLQDPEIGKIRTIAKNDF